MKETTYCVTFKRKDIFMVNLVKSSLPKEMIEMYLKNNTKYEEIINIREATADDIRPSMPIVKISITSEIIYA